MLYKWPINTLKHVHIHDIWYYSTPIRLPKIKKKLLNTKCCRDLECPNSCTAGGSGYSYVHTEKLSGNISQK